MTADLAGVLKGIQLLLGAQLIVVAVLHLITKVDSIRLWLSLLCLIFGLWFFKHAFAGTWNQNLLLFLIIGPGKPIFVGSILLCYYQSISGHFRRKSALYYFILPSTYYLFLLSSRFFLRADVSTQASFWLSIGFSVATLIIFWFYFVLTRREILENIQPKLIAKAYKRVLFLFYLLYFFLLQIPIWDILDKLDRFGLLTGEYSWLQYAYQNVFIYIGYYASYSYIHILGYVVFLYAVSELPYLKKYILPRQTSKEASVWQDKSDLERRIQEGLIENKLYKIPDLTIDTCAQQIGIPKKKFAQYLQVSKKLGFRDFINQLRTEEFKKLSTDPSYSNYDLVGIALECGFRSKSTFHRVFKEKEGITPSEYKRQLGEALG